MPAKSKTKVPVTSMLYWLDQAVSIQEQLARTFYEADAERFGLRGNRHKWGNISESAKTRYSVYAAHAIAFFAASVKEH